MTRLVAALSFVLVPLFPALAQAPTPEQKKATVAYVQSLQKEGGGFAADKGKDTPATLPATSSALRALKYFGGEAKNKEAAEKFIVSCLDKETKGFAATPGGKPDVRTTAVGVMAYRDNITTPNPDVTAAAISYLRKNAKNFEEIRIMAAAVERLLGASAKGRFDDQIKEIAMLRNPDGTYGKGGAVARDTGGAVAAILRLGGTVENKDAVVKALKAGQLRDGGWGKESDKADLETSYRVMRAFVMLKEKPDIAAVHKFVASCRNDDGSYSVTPGQPGNVSATYFAGIISHWLEEMK